MNGKKVQELIDAKGWNNYWVGKQVGLTENQFSQCKSNRRQITPGQLESLAALLGVTVPEIDNNQPENNEQLPDNTEAR